MTKNPNAGPHHKPNVPSYLTLTLLLIVSCRSNVSETVAAGPTLPVRQPAPLTVSIRRARTALERGRAKEAESRAEQIIEEAPLRPEGYAILGRALAQQERLEASADAYEKALTRHARAREVFAELASVYDVSERYRDAIRVYRAYLEIDGRDGEMHQQLGLSLLLFDDLGPAIEHLETASTLAPEDRQIQEDLAYALLRAERLPEAQKILEALVAVDPDRHQTVLFLAQTMAAQGKLRPALKLLGRAIALDPTDPVPVRLRARVKRNLGDPRGAEADYQTLLRADPRDASAAIGLAGVYLQLNNLDAAEEAVNRAAAVTGDHSSIRFRRLQIAWRRGKKTAVQNLYTFARQHPDTLEVWQELATAAKKAGHRQWAREADQKLKELQR